VAVGSPADKPLRRRTRVPGTVVIGPKPRRVW
jgi:hypothetical protein